nr:U32 family peptidase [Bacteroidales bacterium]
GQKLGEWSKNYGSEATTRKFLLGKCTNFFTNLEVAEFLMQSGELNEGDEILISGPTTGVIEMIATGIHVNLQSVAKTIKGESFSIKTPVKIRRGDTLYKIVQHSPKT